MKYGKLGSVKNLEFQLLQEKPKEEIDEGVSHVFEQFPELASIGTKGQYNEYIKNIFPDSKFKKVVYHGTMASENVLREGFDSSYGGSLHRSGTDQSFYFGTSYENSYENYAHKKDLIKVAELLQTVQDHFEGEIKTTDQLYNELDELRERSRVIYNDFKHNIPAQISNRNTIQKVMGAVLSFAGKKDLKAKLLESQEELKEEYDQLEKRIEQIKTKDLLISEDYHSGIDQVRTRARSPNLFNISKFIEELSTEVSEDNKQKAFELLYDKKDIKYTPKVLCIVLDIRNPLEFDLGYQKESPNPIREKKGKFDLSFLEYNSRLGNMYDQFKQSEHDGLIEKNLFDVDFTDVVIVDKPEKIHILGSAKDIKSFSKFVERKNTK